jgi:hypothetical protein
MRLTWRDALATVFVLVAALSYALWLAGIEVFGMSSPTAVGVVVMALGMAASVTAVVYGVGAGLLQAPKIYLAVTSVLGLAALAAGIVAIVDASEPMLAVLAAATVVMWLLSTIRHSGIAGRGRDERTAHAVAHPA